MSSSSKASDIPEEQRKVQRLLGRCLLRLQQYERLLKALLSAKSRNAVSADGHGWTFKDKDIWSRQTLGMLVRDLLTGYLTTEEIDPEISDDSKPFANFQMQFTARLGVSADDYEQIEKDLGALVALRNDLVHHFIEQHDIWTTGGCQDAQRFLEDAYEQIDLGYRQLYPFAEGLRRFYAVLLDTYETGQLNVPEDPPEDP